MNALQGIDPNPSSAQRMVAAIGHYGMWGHSSTFDFIEAILNASEGEHAEVGSDGDLQPLRVLLVHPGDIRHIITTLCRRRRHKYKPGGTSVNAKLRPIEFYLMEPVVELLARDLLLLEILFDFEVPIRQRAAVFLEVFGNALVQDRTRRYMERLGVQLRDLVAHGVGIQEDIMDFSHLKYRERDELERCFNSYRIPKHVGTGSHDTDKDDHEQEDPKRFRDPSIPPGGFDMASLRDHRLRGWYGERYDSRKALADYDYHYVLGGTCADIVHIKQYKEWRISGCAFELGDHVYTEGNCTMFTYAEGIMKHGKDKGLKKEVRGFWGDITISPYFSFGVDADTRIDYMRSCGALGDSTVNKKALETKKFSDAGAGDCDLHKLTEDLFEIYNKGTGTEQHRHNTAEVAMYNMFSYLWELETGKAYVMTKANDIYSGLGAEAGLNADLKQQALNAKEEAEADSQQNEDSELPPEPDSGRVEESAVEAIPPAPPLDTKKGLKDANATEDYEEKQRQQEEEELAKSIHRAETIVEGLEGISVKVLLGQPSSTLYTHMSKFEGLFDGAFVSSRALGVLSQEQFPALLKPEALLGVESSKYMVPLTKKQKSSLDDKVFEMIAAHDARGGLKAVPHTCDIIPRRKRDETQHDVMFFRKV